MAAVTNEPSVPVKQFGTEEPAAPSRLLGAGPLTATLEAGNLRHIRFGGVEVIRAIAFIVGPARDGFILDDDSFVAASQDVDALSHLTRPHAGDGVILQPYAIARFRLA